MYVERLGYSNKTKYLNAPQRDIRRVDYLALPSLASVRNPKYGSIK
jgi:hypothetical protein